MKESVFWQDKSMLEGSSYLIFYKNATVFIFEKKKTPKSCIQFLYSNPICFFILKIQTEYKYNQTSFLVGGLVKTENEYIIHHFSFSASCFFDWDI